MFDIGFWEIIIIVLVALLVVGPERLPGLAREIGRWVGKTRRFVHSVRSDFEQELQTEELRKMLQSQEREIRQLKGTMEETEKDLREDLEETEKDLREDIEGKPSSRKGLTRDHLKALGDKRAATDKKAKKPAVRERRTADADDTQGEGDPEQAEVRRVPTRSGIDGNLMTDDPALEAERKARAGEADRPSRKKPAVRPRRTAKSDTPESADRPDADQDQASDPTHDDQAPDKHS
ncbi:MULTISPECIES: Sec-independent protein translocase protein TatB [unclassified Thioalkalivibrio]|uniref:Sec-independent protein translocase protein TatB n=1 Tax=unclassified Thioalkalivibrio TaxID=2621013 RepID=UPI00037639B8|nr:MULTISPECIES: Sec-independent protein translocase protein TatB [unclassified Thioalkalivibrio]